MAAGSQVLEGARSELLAQGQKPQLASFLSPSFFSFHHEALIVFCSAVSECQMYAMSSGSSGPQVAVCKHEGKVRNEVDWGGASQMSLSVLFVTVSFADLVAVFPSWCTNLLEVLASKS